MVLITDDSFNSDVLNATGLVLVDMWAEWCRPCKEMRPIIEELAMNYAGQITVGNFNVEDNPRIPPQYDVHSIPTFLFFKDGKLLDKIVGAHPKEEYENRIEKYK
ncbi:thioredoxin [Chitinophaga skermanii]|uniref:Thioredoxin n=1 Tax=Chitinophaga skermanii TaxID=331697 RepID=A0A327R267_9BACT|nr:thioredoxin [Chitinophaga skermanii]RAJ10906.1 thioredoxin [Chitinophaga skermanii]